MCDVFVLNTMKVSYIMAEASSQFTTLFDLNTKTHDRQKVMHVCTIDF